MTVLDFPVPFREGDRNPFDADIVNMYRKASWPTLIPLPYGRQDPPPIGFTGRNAKKITIDQYKTWIRDSRKGVKIQLGMIEGPKSAGPSNIAIIHGFETISIDVDDYEYLNKKTNKREHKLGGQSLKNLEAELGRLPSTWISSARGNPAGNPSGQRFFRLRPEHATNVLRYNDKPADSIEIVRAGHRYSVVWPSMNARLDEVYVWWKRLKRDGVEMWKPQDSPPSVGELPYLPERWVEFLTSGYTPYQEAKKTAAGVFTRSDMLAWIDERALNGSWDTDDNDQVIGGKFEPEPCRAMASAIDSAIEDLADGTGGAHDIMAKKLWHAIGLAHEGHSGLKVFLGSLHDSFVDEVQGRRDGGKSEAEDEWNRALIGAFEYATAREDPAATSCPCFRVDAGGSSGEGAGKDPADIVQNDDGNAELLVDMAGQNIRYASGWGEWLVWSEEHGHWQPNAHNEVVVMARSVSIAQQNRASDIYQYIADNSPEKSERDRLEKKAKKLYAWGIASGNRNRIKSMIELAMSHEGVATSAEAFNSDPRILACRNTTLELEPRRPDMAEMGEPIRLRDPSREDCNTYTTGIDYIPWSEIREGGEGAALVRSRRIVEDYLDTFIPDRGLRWYIQRIFGYGMYGANPERKIVFLHGPTSSGKSTILSAVSSALGGYAGPFNLSLLRDKQDEGPRAELVNAMHRRIITATEGGGEWHLHADMIKRITGGSDALSARKLYSNDIVEKVPNFTPFVASNSSPTIDAADSATYRRLVVLPFHIQVGVDDSPIPDSVAIQKAGMDAFMVSDVGCRMVWLSWLVEGYTGYAREGIHDMPRAAHIATEVFKTNLNDLNLFLQDVLICDETSLGNSIPYNHLYQAYETWCYEQRVRDRDRLSSIMFARKLRNNDIEILKRWRRKGDDDWDPKRRAKGVYVEHSRFVTPDDGDDAGKRSFNLKQFQKQFEDKVDAVTQRKAEDEEAKKGD